MLLECKIKNIITLFEVKIKSYTKLQSMKASEQSVLIVI